MKKWLSLVLAVTMLLTLVGCNGRIKVAGGGYGGSLISQRPTNNSQEATPPMDVEDTAPTAATMPTESPMPTEPTEPDPEQEYYQITLWVPEYMEDAVWAQIDAFNENNPYNLYFDAYIETCYLGDVAGYKIADPYGGADLFFFESQGLELMLNAGALSQLTPWAQKEAESSNCTFAVDAASAYGGMFAFPAAINNGYFMYYDKSVISEKDVHSLEAIVMACEKYGRPFSFDTRNGWYLSSFFFGTGCTSQWQIDGEGNIISVADNFDSEMGYAALAGLDILLQSDYHLNSSFAGDFSAYNSSAVVISGSWDYEYAQYLLGDNLGVAELPSFFYNSKFYHLSGFGGCALLGVMPQYDEARETALMYLAQYLTGEECQLNNMEYDQTWIPTNVEAQKSQTVQNNPCAVAMINQSRYMVPQRHIHGAWWDVVICIPDWMNSGLDRWTVLSQYSEALQQIFVEHACWSVMGSVHGSIWNKDFDMQMMSDGTYRTVEPLWFEYDSEYKIRYGYSWDINYGQDGVFDGPNCMPGVIGYYYVWFDPATGYSWLT